MWEGNLLPWQIDRFQTKTIITIMWVGNLLPFDRFQKKNNYNYVKGQFTTFWQIPDKKNNYKKIITIIQLCERAIYYLLTDSRQKNNYNYVRGQFTTFWQRQKK